MKKKFLFFSFLLIVIGSTGQTGASCLTAMSFSPSQPSQIHESQTQQTQWYSFQSEATQVKITLFNTINATSDKANKITLWGGSCGSLVMVATDTLTNPSDSILSITANSIVSNTIYYLQVDKSTNTDLIKYTTSFQYKFTASCFDCFTPITNACDLICNGSFEEGATPANYSELDNACAWYNATGATPDYFTTSGGPNVNIPSNGVGIQSPNTGSAYAGVIAYGPQPFGSPPFQEYFAQELRAL